MAIVITSTSRGSGAASLRKTGSGGDFINLSDLANPNTSVETVGGATVKEVIWTVSSGTVTIARGGNTIFDGGGTSGQVTLSGFGLEAGGDAQSNVIITTTATGTVLVKLHKQSGALNL